MATNIDSIIYFTKEHIDTFLITSANINKENARSVFEVQEETREIAKNIFTENMKMEVTVTPNRDYIEKRSTCFWNKFPACNTC